MRLKRIQLGLIHVAVAITLVPINSTLNRVMIKDMALSATLVAVLASLPYLFAPLQVAIGSYSDRHPVLGRRRTPYIVLGILLCAAGVSLSPWAAIRLAAGGPAGLLWSALVFGAWGMGYNLSTVSYLSMAAEISDEKDRGGTIAVMWFMMIVSIILTAVGLSRMLDPYTPQALESAFRAVGVAALVLGGIGLIGLEPPPGQRPGARAEVHSVGEMARAILGNRQAANFFVYLWLLLAAILGQDILLEPFGAQAFGLSVTETTRITSLWGTFVLIAIVAAGALERRLPRKRVAQIGNAGALAGFLVIILSGAAGGLGAFYTGVALLGAGTGIATVANLALMFDLTVPKQVGLYVGAWGFSNAMSRLTGSVVGGIVRDSATQALHSLLLGYLAVFGLEALLLLAAILMLSGIDVQAFHKSAQMPSAVERAALAD